MENLLFTHISSFSWIRGYRWKMLEKNKTLSSDLSGNGYAGVVPLVRTLPGPKLHVGMQHRHASVLCPEMR